MYMLCNKILHNFYEMALLTCLELYILFIFTLVEVDNAYTVDPKCALPLPKSYVAYHLQSGEKIHVDGKLDEPAWERVAWTDPFIDIQGLKFPKPRYLTKTKLRWDDYYLYIGAYLEERDVWANQTKSGTGIFGDNVLEVFVDPDGSTHYYKEFEINAINITFDLELNKPYMNGGSPNYNWGMPTMESGVFVDGPVNNPLVPDKYWTVELAFPFKDLIHGTFKATAPPKDKDTWRINLSRAEWRVRDVNGHYEKVPGAPLDYWVWSSQEALAMHVPERWGFVQFSEDTVNSTSFKYDADQWAVYTSLVQTYYAMKEFFAINGYYTGLMWQLTNLPDFVAKGECASVPVINATTYSFNVTCRPRDFTKNLVGHIRDDRLIWFTSK